MQRFTHIRLMADDLTGALDSAASFVGAFANLRVAAGANEDGSFIVNSASRECRAEEAAQIVSRLASSLAPAPGRLCFFKVDSLLRGHAAEELHALLSQVAFDRVVIAPAVPAQRRATRNGRQHVWANGAWVATGQDLAAELRRFGETLAHGQAEAALARGLSIFDAETDADLDAIVARSLACQGSILFVGAAGLAAALARKLDRAAPQPPALSSPLLGLIGSDHAVMQAQLQRVSHLCAPAQDKDAILARLKVQDAVFASCDLPRGVTRESAREEIARIFADLVSTVPAPRSLFVSGGETLQALLAPLQVQSLVLLGECAPGVPVSRIEGGPWSGVIVISKSGAFGAPDFLLRLVQNLNTHSKAVVA